MENRTWYEANTGNHQGLIIEEETGKNIAVSYDKKDARLIAAAPDLLEALIDAYYLMQKSGSFIDNSPIFKKMETAIAKAEGRE